MIRIRIGAQAAIVLLALIGMGFMVVMPPDLRVDWAAIIVAAMLVCTLRELTHHGQQR